MTKPEDKNHQYGVLTVDEIKYSKIIRLEEGQKMDEDCFSNASYDLRLGLKYYVPSSPEQYCDVAQVSLSEKCRYKGDPDIKKNIIDSKKANGVIKIKPFSSIVFSTYEIVKLPNNVAGRFDIRIQWALQGFILQVGTQIEPGYEGRLFGLVHNFSKNEIGIPAKERFLTAEFYYTSKETSPIVKDGKQDKPLLRIEDFILKFPVITGSLENYLMQMKFVNDEFQKKWDKKLDTRKNELDNIFNTRKDEVDTSFNKFQKKWEEELKDISDKYNKTDNQINTQKSEVEKLLNRNIETSRFKENLRVVLWGILITIFITVPLTVAVPLYVTKLTVDKDDYPFQKVYEMETENQLMHSKIDSVIDDNQKTIKNLLLDFSVAQDSIKALNSEKIRLENELQKQIENSKKIKNGK